MIGGTGVPQVDLETLKLVPARYLTLSGVRPGFSNT